MTKETIYTDEEGILFMYLASYELQGRAKPSYLLGGKPCRRGEPSESHGRERHGHGALGRPAASAGSGGKPNMTEVQAAATNRLRRKLEILKLDASKVRGQLFHDLQECIALMDIIDKRKED
jgi:hypothetical protein